MSRRGVGMTWRVGIENWHSLPSFYDVFQLREAFKTNIETMKAKPFLLLRNRRRWADEKKIDNFSGPPGVRFEQLKS